MNTPKIFISATSGDLRSARQMAKDALLTINCHPVEQSNFEPDWRTVEGMLRGKIGGCQALIHLVGLRYGAEPEPATLPPGTPRRSYTQMEYHVARELGLRVYTFLLPETYPYDEPKDADTPEQAALQAAHRAFIESRPHLYECPASDLDLRTRIIALQEKVIGLEQVHASVVEEVKSVAKEVKMGRRWGVWAAVAIVLMLGGIGVWQWQKGFVPITQGQEKLAAQVKQGTADITAGQNELAAQMTQVQEALSRMQQQTDPAKDPISQWPQERLEQELARQMNFKVEDLRALLQAGKTSLDALVQGQALLASGKAAEAGAKFDAVITQEQSALQRLKQAYEGKAQIAFDQVKYEEALDYLQKAAALVDKAAEPLAWAGAQGGVTFILFHLARYREAEPLMREIVSLREQHLGANHAALATALNNLAQLLNATNRLEEAEPLMRRALKIDETSYGPENPRVAIRLNNLASLLQARNRLVEAEPLMQRALKIDETSYGPEHPNVAIRLNNLASLLQATNRLAEAEPLMQRVVTILENKGGEPLPNYAAALNNLATLLKATNRLPEAEPLMQRALKIDETIFGPDHPEVATDLNNLAQLLKDTNRLAEAEPLMRRALKIDEISYGPEHPNVAIRLNNLAQLLKDTNRLPEAEPLMRRALKIDETSYGPEHPEVAIDLNNLAQLLQDTNRLAEAEPLMRRSVGIRFSFQASTGHRHSGSLTVVENYLLLAREMNAADTDTYARLDKLRQEAGLEAAAFEAIWQEVLAANPAKIFQVVITEVAAGGQAEALGLQAGDVYVSYNGQAITRGDQLIRLAGEAKGDAVPLEVLRAGRKLSFTAKPGKLLTRIENRPVVPAAGEGTGK